MKYFRAFLTPYRIAITVALTLMLTELAVELTLPLLLSKIIDEGILQEDLSYVIKWGSIMVGLAFLAFASGVTNSFYAAHVGQSFGFDIRKALFEKVQGFSFEQLGNYPAASLVTRMTNDVTQLQNTIFMGLRIMLRAPLLVIGSVVMSFFVHPGIALVFAVVIPIVVVVLTFLMKKGSSLFGQVQSRLDRVNDVLRENLMGMKVIKAFVRKNHESNRFHQATNELKDLTVKALRLTEAAIPLLLLLMNIAILFLLWNGRSAVIDGSVQVGDVVAVINYGFRTTAALSMFSFIIMFLSRTKASLDRVSEVLDTTENEWVVHTKRKDNQGSWLQFNHVSFTYPGNNDQVVKDITFEVDKGERIAIMGETGAGKSSILQLLLRLYEVDEGSILFMYQDIRVQTLKELRHKIGFVPQEAVLFSGTIRENLLWGKEDATEEELTKAVKAAQIYETIEQFPHGYDTRIGQKGVNLSGGQKQRISIARALIRRTSLLILDDSTSALDVTTEQKLLKALEDYECTILLVTHKVRTAKMCDRIFLIEEGRMIGEGNHEELLATIPLYEDIVQSQEEGVSV
ncbi:ABC transporter ATP-binding protein [Bacillus coahuilensis p1.1.43]|uniref:ABC transporter ATP-binding protein n=1 Tax=Bacillus coahuilensis p1.1.43 TaxID=1150625 RepID=A0A147KBL0_9BACI|nr:ABC transporter ATP-binding protein [Bacillus coahuilensis]KUP08823.1 ABC transporter ATP-binding protein [Bacillus coahuilensis p1.1.43]